MKKILILLLLAGIGAVAAVGYTQHLLDEPYRGYSGEVVVDVAPGTGSEEIVDELIGRGVLRYRYPSLAYLYFSDHRGRLQAGEYVFREPLTAEQVFARLSSGDVRLYTLTVPEGLLIGEVAGRWEEAGFGSSDDFLAAAEAALPRVREIDPRAVSVEGYLFPETYSFRKNVTEAEAVEAMVRGFEAAIARLDQAVPPEDRPLDLNGTLILASLVEAEASVDDERPLVASVFVNRLDRGMRLECDPTVIYALIQDGSYRGRLLRKDLTFDSPYNTYRYADLPPGPIANPGYLSLLAAARPAQTEYLFFVRTDGGRHTFSRTLAEHNRAVAAYRRGVSN